jgi:Icc-related predicted phosphoesterase
MSERTARVAALGDLHCTKTSAGAFQPLLARISEGADVLALCGDLTDYGTPEEAQVLAEELRVATVPIVAVLGNHDYESGKQAEVRRILADSGVHILDGDTFEFRGVGFAGVKGFAGGFGTHALAPWGEETLKRFVQEALDETLKLETAVGRLRTLSRIVIMHYAPVEETVRGEPLEIYPFLGSSRLEEPIDRYGVTAVFHGHAHSGALEGRTKGGVPVYNVSLPLLRARLSAGSPFRVLEVPVETPAIA